MRNRFRDERTLRYVTMTILLVILWTVVIAALMVVMPLIGYGTGFIVKATIGKQLAEGLNLIFNTERFSPDSIPPICAVLALIGVLTRGSTGSVKNKNEN